MACFWPGWLKSEESDLIRLLESEGWRLRSTKGSHRQFKHSARELLVTVPGPLGDDLPVGTLKSILRTAGLDKRWKQ